MVSTAASAPQGPVDILKPKEPHVKSKPKIQYPDKVPFLAQMKGFFPVDKDSLHNTSIPNYHVKRTGSSQKGRSIYMCPYEADCSTLPYSGDIASTGSHARHHHLGHSCVCQYCRLHFYNAAGWRDHMTSKHMGMPLYGSEVGTMVLPMSIPVAAAGESLPTTVTVPIPAPASVPEPDPVDTLPYVPDAKEEEEGEVPTSETTDTATAPPSQPGSSQANPPAQGIDSYSLKDIRHLIQFSPSDLHQFSYFGGGNQLGRCRKDDSQTMLFAANIVADPAKLEAEKPEEGEEPLVKKRHKHEMHIYPQEHHGKIWHPANPDDDPDRGTLTV